MRQPSPDRDRELSSQPVVNSSFANEATNFMTTIPRKSAQFLFVVVTLFLFVTVFCFRSTAQTVVTLNSQTYQLKSHPRVLLDGSGGALTTSMADPRRVTKANPAYAGMQNAVTQFKNNACGTGLGYQCDNSIYQGSGQAGQALLDAALLARHRGLNR